jgi:hypothetical protein
VAAANYPQVSIGPLLKKIKELEGGSHVVVDEKNFLQFEYSYFLLQVLIGTDDQEVSFGSPAMQMHCDQFAEKS